MNILGISSDYHDSSACILADGELLSLYYEDRFTYNKHDSSFPANAILENLANHNLSTKDIDAVAYYENPYSKSIRQLTCSLSSFPHNSHSFVGTAKKITSNMLIKYNISKQLDIDESKIHFIPHHLSHATYAFASSGFQESAIITVDTVGEWVSTGIWKAKYNSQNKLEIAPVELISFPQSLGLFYSAVTGYLGFKVNDGECSTMALAAFGKPVYVNEFREILKLNQDGSFKLDHTYFNFSASDQLPVTKKFTKLFGPPRSLENKINYCCLDLITDDPASEKMADIAASAQKVFEEAILGLFKRAHNLTKLENICYSGGAALNCVANKKIVSSMIFKDIFIPADPGDGGSSVGAAIYLSNTIGTQNKLAPTPFLGRSSGTILFEKTWAGVDTTQWNNSPHKNEFEIITLKDDSFYVRIAQEIADGKIIGLVQGNAEIGPRALGHRSILARADDISIAKKISREIKLRASFRPYACSILKEDAYKYFENFIDCKLNQWMQTSIEVKKDFFDKFKAVIHIDGTTRPQVCMNDESELTKILTEYKKISGVGVLLNTSLNEAGSPIAGTAIDALAIFARTPIDILIVEKNLLIRKNR